MTREREDDMTSLDWTGTDGPDFVTRPAHRAWLLDQARGLFDFFQFTAPNPAGGFFPLDTRGRPLRGKNCHRVVPQRSTRRPPADCSTVDP